MLWLLGLGYATMAVSVSGALPQPTPAQLVSSENALTAPAPWDPQVLREPWITEDPEAGFAFVHIWQQYGHPFPDALLKKIVEAAFRPEAPWDHTKAGITQFALYHDRPWVTEVLGPFVTYHTLHILVNVDFFARLNRAWTKTAIELAAPQAPTWILRELRPLAAIDTAWAKQLAATAAATVPQAVLPHADALLAVDPLWAQKLLRTVTQRYPYDAVRLLHKYLPAPWAQDLFAAAVLTDPRWVVGLALSSQASDQAVIAALQQTTAPPLHVLTQLVQSAYPDETKSKMAVFAHDIVAGRLTLEEAARLSSQDSAYLRTLVDMKLADHEGTNRAVETALQEELLTLTERLNSLFESPAAIRFRAVDHWAARELYMLITYSDTDLFTSSYLGVFDRLLMQMRQERLTGDQLLTQVNALNFRVFIKLAAMFHRLDSFLATIPSTVARWSLLTQCVSDLTAGQEVPTQAMTAAELLAAPLDAHTLRLLQETLQVEYARAVQEQNQDAMIIYGLLLATLVQRHAPEASDAESTAIATPYLPALPDYTRIPLERMFHDETSIQWYFFYNDDDGQQSFHSFLTQYQHTKVWRIEDHGSFIHVVSQPPGRRIEIYANTFSEDDTGVSAIEAVFRERHVTPSVIVHRGHSPYVEQTIAKIPPTAALVFLGNCGGSTLLDAVLNHAPHTHLITTKGIGSLTINDPLLKALNDYLLRGQDLTWASFWRSVAPRLAHNPRFADYVPPDKNAGMLFLRAYRNLRRERQEAAR
jgi:hypothetical protein